MKVANTFHDDAKRAAPEPADRQFFKNRKASKSKSLQSLRNFDKFPDEEIETSIPDRFERMVRKYPDRLAIKTLACSVTYENLNAMANRAAAALLQHRVDTTRPVAILFAKDAPLIAAMLGVLKAGRFFVLLDPSHPRQRLVSMLQDSQAPLLFTDQVNVSLASEIVGGDQKLLNFALLDQTISVENPPRQVASDALAFIAYTSGSTGEPKAVIQNHRNILFDSANYIRAYPISEQDRFGHLTSGTASAIRGALHPLMKGAAVLLFDVKAQGVSALAHWLLQERVSICLMASSLFRSFCETLTGQERFADLRVLRLLSETIHKSDLKLYKAHFPATCALVSGLASTETGMLRLYFMNHETIVTGDDFPLGYPIEGKDIVILDNDGQEVATGEVGEIVVKSEYLSPGYWRNPDLTGAKFKSDLAGEPTRLYYTGDLGLMLSDGCLVHKGRKDFRVKIRGYGVDLVEVERVLVEHPAIEKAVVVAAKNDSGENYLIAYITSTVKPPPEASVLRNYLSAILPDYSVPAFFVQLESLPLTSSGKIDRNALPRPDKLRPNLSVPYIEPRNPVEKKLAEIWAEVLGVERVGVRDDFFDFGGHSLLAARLFLRIHKVFGKQLSPPTLLYARTIEGLADIVRQEVEPSPRSLLVPIQPDGCRPPFFWACGYSSDIYLPRLLEQGQPLYGLLNQCHDGNRAVYSRLEDIAAHHIQEIRAVQPRGPYYLGGFCFGGMVAFEMAQQLKRQGQEVALLFLVDLGTIVNVKALTDQISDSSKLHAKIETFRKKLYRHLDALKKLKPRERCGYVWVRAVATIRRVFSMGRGIVNKLCFRGCEITGRTIPLPLQLKYIIRVDRKVLRDYRPQPYSGRVVHIKAQASTYDPQLVAKLSGADLEAYELPCRHGDLISETHIHLWAKILQSYLTKDSANGLTQSDNAKVNHLVPPLTHFQ